jgi:isocitrate lyase
VPNKVHQLFTAQLFHDRKQREARRGMSASQRAKETPIDYLRPIVGMHRLPNMALFSFCFHS